MSRIFGRHLSVRAAPVREEVPAEDPASAYESLLQAGPRARSGAALQETPRHWMTAEARRASWMGERPTKKLVKEPSGSARPSFSVEISDSDAEKEKSAVRRKMQRLKELYHAVK